MKTFTAAIDLSPVYRLYPGCTVIRITQFYVPGKGFTTILPDGNRCTDNDQCIDDVFNQCIDAGATSVQIQVKSKKTGMSAFPDYSINELL